MQLIKRILTISFIFSLILIYSFKVKAFTPVEIHSDYGANNQWPSQRLGLTDNDILYIAYHGDALNLIKCAYSDNGGSSWTIETVSSVSNRHNPSLYIDTNTVHAAYGYWAAPNQPIYKYRNGSWSAAQDITSEISGPAYPQIAMSESGILYCSFLLGGDISISDKSGGTWDAKVDLGGVGAGFTAKSLSACMDGNNNMHCIWYAEDPNNFKISTAYFNGTSWSSIHTFETFLTSYSYTDPTINNVNGNLIATWGRKGVGTNTDYIQIRYSVSTSLGTWTSAGNVTDRGYNNYHPDVCGGNHNYYYCVFTGANIDPNNAAAVNLAYSYYNGSLWSSPIQLTTGSVNKTRPSILNDGIDIHILWAETTTTKQFYGYLGTNAISAYTPLKIIINIE